MKNTHLRTWTFYVLMLSLFCIFTYFLFQHGKVFDVHSIAQSKVTPAIQNVIPESNFSMFRQSLLNNVAEPAAMLLLQIISVLFVSRVFGYLFAKIGQPTVIGEILAGIVLGPSLLGYFYPDAFHFLFAAKSLGNLYILSQVGLILFMFTIGMELNLSTLKEKISETYVISHASILIPYFLGMLLAYFVYKEFAASQTDFLSFALFIGISMSITAFPVLARIVQEKGLSKTHLGTMAIASAANDDITAWCVLAAVIAIAKTGSFISSLYTIGFAIGYVIFMLFFVRPFLKRIGAIYSNSEVLNKSVVAFLLLLLILSAFTTQVIGIHALFGAFLFGVVMPQLPNFRKLIIDKIEDVSVTLLLPLFFVFTGLRTQIGLLNSPYLWGVCGIFIFVAISGKFIGGAFTARILGETWRDSLSLGVLMNTRGLMELIVLNIGYEMGILPPSIFVMLVIMALVTTFMTTPVLSLITRLFPEKDVEKEYILHQTQGIFKALIALGNPENGKSLLHVAKTVLDGTKNSLAVSVLHITPGTDTNPIYGEQFSVDSFKGIQDEAIMQNIPLVTEYKVTDNIEQGIVKSANYNNFDFLLVGAGISLSGIPFFKESPIFQNIKWLNKFINNITYQQTFFYPGSLIKDKTRYFIENSNCSVGVFINRGFTAITSTLIVLHHESDEFLLRYARRLMKNNPEVTINIIDINKLAATSEVIREGIRELRHQFPNHVKVNKLTHLNYTVLSKNSFMLISYQTWNILSTSDKKELRDIPSTLIINKKISRFHTGARNKIVSNPPIDHVAESL
ncbi:MAG: cation:proton antiporter [Bacteroidota bacterium]|nr:cation:proton antiporter [Bacteroidota bacterium]